MTFPKYIHLRFNNQQQRYSHIYANDEEEARHFVLGSIFHRHERFLYSFFSVVLDIWKSFPDNPNRAIRQWNFWKQQLWIEMGPLFCFETRCWGGGRVLLFVLDGLLEWLWLYNGGEAVGMSATRNDDDQWKDSNGIGKNEYRMEDAVSVSTSSPPLVVGGDMRNKRQSSSSALMTKSARKILNDWFDANIHHPYPSEGVKRELANKAGISIEQVNTFFGNKRMRTKRKLAKLFRNQQESGSSNFSPRYRWQKMIFPQLQQLQMSKPSKKRNQMT